MIIFRSPFSKNNHSKMRDRYKCLREKVYKNDEFFGRNSAKKIIPKPQMGINVQENDDVRDEINKRACS